MYIHIYSALHIYVSYTLHDYIETYYIHNIPVCILCTLARLHRIIEFVFKNSPPRKWVPCCLPYLTSTPNLQTLEYFPRRKIRIEPPRVQDLHASLKKEKPMLEGGLEENQKQANQFCRAYTHIPASSVFVTSGELLLLIPALFGTTGLGSWNIASLKG